MYELINSTAIIEPGFKTMVTHNPISWIILGVVFLIIWEIIYILIMKSSSKPRKESWGSFCISWKFLAFFITISIMIGFPIFGLFLIENLISILITIGAIVILVGFFKLNIDLGKAVGKEEPKPNQAGYKFKDGEKVRVKKNLDDIKNYEKDVTNRKRKLEGKIVTITSHDDDITFHVKELPSDNHLQDCCVEKIRSSKSKKKSKVKKG